MSVWNHIEKSDQYQGLDEAGKAKLRRDYFNEFMVSDPAFGKLPEPEREKVYLEFVNQGMQPLEQVPETPITDFVGAQDKLAGQAVGVLDKMGMPTTTPAAGPAPLVPTELAQAHPMPPPQVDPFAYPIEMQPAHKPMAPEPFRLPDVNIPESVEPVLNMDPNLVRPYEAQASENLARDISSMMGALSGGAGYIAGLAKGPEPGGREMPALEQRHAKGVEYAEKMTAPFTKFNEAIATTPETGLDIAFQKLNEVGDKAGASELKRTGNPYWAAAVATTIQAAPILLPLIGRKMPGLFRRLRASTPYRQMAVKERALVVQTLEETLAKNPEMTEAEILRKYPQYFEAAREKRAATEQPIGEKPIAPEPEPGPVEPTEFYIKKNNIPDSIEKLKTLRKRYAENDITGEIPKVDQAIKSLEDLTVAPAGAAPEPGQVTPSPGQRPAPPTPQIEAPEKPPVSDEKRGLINAIQAYARTFEEKAGQGDNAAVADYANIQKFSRYVEEGKWPAEFMIDVLDQHPELKKLNYDNARIEAYKKRIAKEKPAEPEIEIGPAEEEPEDLKSENVPSRQEIADYINKEVSDEYEKSLHGAIKPDENYVGIVQKSIKDFFDGNLDELLFREIPMIGRIRQPLANAGNQPGYAKPFEHYTGFKLPWDITTKKQEAELIKKMREFLEKRKETPTEPEAPPETKPGEPTEPVEIAKLPIISNYVDIPPKTQESLSAAIKENPGLFFHSADWHTITLDDGSQLDFVVRKLKNGEYALSLEGHTEGGKYGIGAVASTMSKVKVNKTIRQFLKGIKEKPKKESTEPTPADQAKDIDIGEGEPPLPPKEQKKWLLHEVDGAIKEAGTEKAIEDPGSITFHVPGDGEFTIINTKESLRSFRDRAKKTFPEKIQRQIVIRKPAKHPRPSGKRLGGEGVEYYNEFQPRKVSALLEEKDRNRYYKQGYYSNGAYVIKTPKSKVKKEVREEAPDLKEVLSKGEKAKPAIIVGEFKTEYATDPVAHVMTTDEEYHAVFNPAYIDNILTNFPNAKPFMKHGEAMLYFKDGKEIVGAVAGFREMEGTLSDVLDNTDFGARYYKLRPDTTKRAELDKLKKKAPSGIPPREIMINRILSEKTDEYLSREILEGMDQDELVKLYVKDWRKDQPTPSGAASVGKFAETEREAVKMGEKRPSEKADQEEIELMKRLKYESSGFYRKEPTPFQVESRGKFAKTGMKGVEGPEAYGEPPPSGENVNWSGKEIRPLEVPELTRLAKELLGGKYPQVWRRLRIGVLGDFTPIKGRERIRIHAALGADVEQLAKTVAHEIGHLIDYLPEGTLKRGNLLGRLASLKKFMKQTIAADPHGLPPLTPEDRLRIRKEAKEILLKENAGKLIDEVIKKELPVSPQDILNIWNMVENTEGFSADLYDYIASLDTTGKKAIVKAALKGEVPAELKRFAKIIEEKTGEKIKYKPTEAEIAKKYKDLIEAELRKRKSYTAQEIRTELTDFTIRWKPFNPEANIRFTRYRLSGVELYADFLSAILTDPAFAFKYAPKSWDLWHNYMENKPMVKSLYEQIQAELRSGEVDAKAEQALREGFAKREEEWRIEAKRDFPKTMTGDELGYKLIDTKFAVMRRVKRIGETNIPDSINPRYKLSDVQYWASEAEGILTDVLNNIVVPMQKAGVDIRDLDSYLFHRRVANERAEKINPEGWTADRSSAKLIEYDQNTPMLKDMAEAHDKLWQEWVYDDPAFERMFSPELMKYIKDNYGYTTFDIAGFLVGEIGEANTLQALGETTVPGKIYRQVGTFRSTGPPLTASVLQMIRLKRAMVINEAKLSIRDLYRQFREELKGEFFPAKRKWAGKYHRIMPTAHPQMDTIMWMEKGKIQGAYVPKFVAASVKKNPLDWAMTTRIARATAAPFKALFTQYNPGFMMFNIVRDFGKSLLLMPRMNVPRALYWYTKALKPSYRKQYAIPDPVIKAMQKEKILISVANYRGDLPEDLHLERLLKRYQLRPKAWSNNIVIPFERFFYHLDNVGRGIETIPKVAGYMYLKKKFPDLPPEFVRYFVRVAPGSPAFMHRGASAGFYNNVLLYSNAMKEGYRGVFQSFKIGGPEVQKILPNKRRKLEFAYRLTKYHMIPKIAMLLGLVGFFGKGTQEVMEGVSEHDMANYHVIPIGLTESGRSVYLRIPQDEFGRFMGGLMYKVLRGAMGENKWGLELADYMNGQIPSMSPLGGAILDVGLYTTGHVPYDFFRGRPAYPELVGKAGGTREFKEFVKYMSNKMGGGIAHRFNTNDPHEIETEIEKWIAIPGLSNIIGRWIKVSDYGVSQKYRREVGQPYEAEWAEEILSARDAMRKMITGKLDEVTDDEKTAFFNRFPDMQADTVMKLLARRYSSAGMNIILSARTKEERIRAWQWLGEREERLKAEGNQ